MRVAIPELSLVVLIGASGSGKSTFAAKRFAPTEVISSDFCRGLVADDENAQEATSDAFDVLHYITAKRLAAGRLTVVDATSVRREDRKPLVEVARRYHCLPVAIVFNVPERVCHQRNGSRPDRAFGPHVVANQTRQLRRSVKGLKREGFRNVTVLRSVDEVDRVEIVREPLWNDRRDEPGPFDIIGDVHGCCDELESLLDQLGYAVSEAGGFTAYRHPQGRKAVFVGDLVDRGPRILDSLLIARSMREAGSALVVPGNHEMKLLRKLQGRDVQITHGLAESLDELESAPADTKAQIIEFMDSLISHYVLDGGRLVVAHAGMKKEMQGRGSGKVREFALYGETTGETDEFGLPVRYNWAAEYRGSAYVVYGHTPVPEPQWLNKTINIDTGCVFGGRLTALRYPEMELVSVPAAATYSAPAKPFLPEAAPAVLTEQQRQDELLDLADVVGKRFVQTRLRGQVAVREENAAAALEVMSRFAADPKWLIYLPPTMSPCETSNRGALLEHPAEAFSYLRHEGVGAVVCQQKHMGSRAIVIVCRDPDVARRRFGIATGEAGICYTRTGRRFFDDEGLHERFLGIVRSALDGAGFWDELDTDWVCLDCELMPWSAKAQELVRSQYAMVGRAAVSGTGAAVDVLLRAQAAGLDTGGVLERFETRLRHAERFVDAYRHYCWPVKSLGDLKLAPFHVMATEGGVHIDKDHGWHMRVVSDLVRHAPELLLATSHRLVDLSDPASEAATTQWWEQMTSAGGEGMVVKPSAFVSKGHRGVIQPAVKCRGPEYLRVIYGPDYQEPDNIERLRKRGLGVKRSLALREFALGVEGLERFVRKEPLRRVHECVFGVLALESEPVDPRL